MRMSLDCTDDKEPGRGADRQHVCCTALEHCGIFLAGLRSSMDLLGLGDLEQSQEQGQGIHVLVVSYLANGETHARPSLFLECARPNCQN